MGSTNESDLSPLLGNKVETQGELCRARFDLAAPLDIACAL
jgi:hypothetical protein